MRVIHLPLINNLYLMRKIFLLLAVIPSVSSIYAAIWNNSSAKPFPSEMSQQGFAEAMDMLDDLIDEFNDKFLPDHNELTEQWRPEFYEMDIRVGGECNICLFPIENSTLVTPMGCKFFSKRVKDDSLKHGICFPCMTNWIKGGKSRGTSHVKFSHKCLGNKEPHECHITALSVYELLKKFRRGERIELLKKVKLGNWLKKDLPNLIDSLKKQKRTWDELKEYSLLCKKCKLYKEELHKGADGQCPACGTSYNPKNRNTCSIFHCFKCAEKGLDINVCFYCHKSKCGGSGIVCPGSMQDCSDWKCPRDCLVPFQKGLALPAPVCTCNEPNK